MLTPVASFTWRDEVTPVFLVQVAREKVQAGQMAFDLDPPADGGTKAEATGVDAGGGWVLHGTRLRSLCEVMEQACNWMGLSAAVVDEVSK